MSSKKCAACGGLKLEPGFIEDRGESSGGYLRWIPGALEFGIFGGAKRFGRQRFAVEAFRCADCQHVSLYVGQEV